MYNTISGCERENVCARDFPSADSLQPSLRSVNDFESSKAFVGECILLCSTSPCWIDKDRSITTLIRSYNRIVQQPRWRKVRNGVIFYSLLNLLLDNELRFRADTGVEPHSELGFCSCCCDQAQGHDDGKWRRSSSQSHLSRRYIDVMQWGLPLHALFITTRSFLFPSHSWCQPRRACKADIDVGQAVHAQLCYVSLSYVQDVEGPITVLFVVLIVNCNMYGAWDMPRPGNMSRRLEPAEASYVRMDPYPLLIYLVRKCIVH